MAKSITVSQSGGNNRGWEGWMASPTQWTWVWVNSGSWWWTGRPGMLQSMGSQRARHSEMRSQVSLWSISSVQFSSVAQSCLTLWDPVDCSMPGFPVHHQLPEPTQTHVHWVGDAIQPSHSLLSPTPPTFNLSQHQALFKWVSSLHQVAKLLKFQPQSFQWIFRIDFL